MSNHYINLEHNITSTIYEGLLKLGQGNNETISIYYDLDLLNHLLSTTFTTNEACYTYLGPFNQSYPFTHYITCTLEKNRFKFSVTVEGINLIYKQYEKDSYLKELIHLVKSHNFSLEDVLSIFSKSGYEYVLEDSTNEEFQHVIYLKDSQIDPYRYCFTFDQMGGYYHRLLPYDYNKL